jgi:hypothetical protein
MVLKMVIKYAPLVEYGTKADAEKFKETYGGQLFIGRHEAWITVAGGKRRGVFWHPVKGVEVRHNTFMLAKQLGVSGANEESLTPGRLADLFFAEIIGINPERDKKLGKKSGYYGNGYAARARKEESEFIKKLPFSIRSDENYRGIFEYYPHEPQHLIDRDLKSAFASALISAPTLFFYEHINGTPQWIDDEGAMIRLRQIMPELPKWFKHRLVSTLASHKYGIRWGAAFNTAQWAIQKVYDFMKDVREIAGEYGVRYHTDCVTLKGSTPKNIIDAIDAKAEANSFTFGTKALGYGQLWRVEEGFIGYFNPIGSEIQVEHEMKKRGLIYSKKAFTNEMVQNFGSRLSTHVLDAGDRRVLGHWNGVAFFSVCQPVVGELSQSAWFQVYPMDTEKAKQHISKL